MNGNQSIPAVAKLGPLIFVGLIIWAVKEVFFGDEDTEKKLETEPNNTVPAQQKNSFPYPPNSGGNSAENRRFLADSAGKFCGKPVVVPPTSVPAARNPVNPVPVTTIPAVITTPQATPTKRKMVTLENLETIFQYGARKLTRKDAVSSLIGLGFGKSAAYEATSLDGRFAEWLRFAPDGTISWAR